MRTLHLICNAHLDPAWLWEWQEGAAAAISTFRVAAELCERHPGFVFCHNEAVLYQWVEEYEPALFGRIQKLVAKGRWKIMGGWYLQPDCNMPSGESFVRQILLGRVYFRDRFGVEPTTAINFDSFGHNRGLPQILARAGYDSYLICRPSPSECPLPGETFTWVGVEGSRIDVARSGGYNSPLGRAHEKIGHVLSQLAPDDVGYVLWGVGNHGGGPSKKDVETLDALIRDTKDARVRHSWPEAYFSQLEAQRAKGRSKLPLVERDLNPFSVGCYTSQVRIKQKHRRLENELIATKAMATVAAAQRLMPYPSTELAEAQRDLCFAQFHDILPGSSIQAVEEASLQGMDHGLETLARAKARAFFALAQGQPAAAEGEIPVLVHNPHPWPVDAEVECEFQLQDQNWKMEFTNPVVFRDGERLPSQCEQEASNIPLDWRKRVVFRARLEPSRMNRFDCRLETLPQRPTPSLPAEHGLFVLRNDDGLELAISLATGLVDRWRVGGVDVVKPGAFAALVLQDSEDAWGMSVRRFRDVIGAFTPMTSVDSARFSGVKVESLPAVRVVEDGPVRTVVETVTAYGRSALVTRFLFPKAGTLLGVELRVQWAEKDRMLKLSVPVVEAGAWRYLGQVAYGHDVLPANGEEAVAQGWVAAVPDAGLAVGAISDAGYGSDFTPEDGLRLSLVRSPAYSGHPLGPERPITRPDRFTARIDQGERLLRFWFDAAPAAALLARLDAAAAAALRPPMALSFFPHGGGRRPQPGPVIADPAIQLGCCKRAEDGRGWIIRLFNSAAAPRSTSLTLPFAKAKARVSLKPFEIRTLRVNAGKVVEVDLLERPLRAAKRPVRSRPAKSKRAPSKPVRRSRK